MAKRRTPLPAPGLYAARYEVTLPNGSLDETPLPASEWVMAAVIANAPSPTHASEGLHSGAGKLEER